MNFNHRKIWIYGEIHNEKDFWGYYRCFGNCTCYSGWNNEVKENTAVSIVGGADGPTAVFVAGKLNDNLTFILIVIGIVLLGVAVIAFFKRKH